MILLDPRVGSGELLPYFKPYDVPVEIQQLEYGDAMWWGNGHDGPTLVGAERKVVMDFIASMRSNRLSGHQLPGLLEMYQWVYLVIEGVWQCGENGETEVLLGRNWVPLRVGSRAVMFREIDHYLATLEHKRGVTVKYTASPKQTAAWLVSRYKWWTDKDWAKHDSDTGIYAPYEEQVRQRRASFTQPIVGPVERIAAQFPGVAKKAYEFGKLFKSVHEMVNMDAKGLEKVEGIGKKGANRIYDWLRGKQ